MHWAIFQILDENTSRLNAIEESRGIAELYVDQHRPHENDFNIVSFETIDELATMLRRCCGLS